MKYIQTTSQVKLYLTKSTANIQNYIYNNWRNAKKTEQNSQMAIRVSRRQRKLEKTSAKLEFQNQQLQANKRSTENGTK